MGARGAIDVNPPKMHQDHRARREHGCDHSGVCTSASTLIREMTSVFSQDALNVEKLRHCCCVCVNFIDEDGGWIYRHANIEH